jgi:hypothetical protein
MGSTYHIRPTSANWRRSALIAWAEAMTRNTAQQDNAVWEELKRHCTDVETVGVSMACAMFNMINRLNDSFWTELVTPEYNEPQWNAVSDLSIDNIDAPFLSASPKSDRRRGTGHREPGLKGYCPGLFQNPQIPKSSDQVHWCSVKSSSLPDVRPRPSTQTKLSSRT